MPRIDITDVERLALAKAGAQSIPCTHGWRPIETAPKDNTRIIVYATEYTKNGVWGGIEGPWVGEVFWKDGWYGDKPGGWMIANCDEEYGCFVVATHWQPLPKLPQEEI